MIAQPSGVVGRGYEAAAEGVHLGERTDFAGVAEVVGVTAAGEARTRGRFHGDDPVIRFSAQFFAHERRDQAAEVGTAARAADDDVRSDPVLVERGLGLQSDDALVQQHLREHRTEHIAESGSRYGGFHRLGDRASQTAGSPGELLEYPASGLGGVGRRGRHGRAVGAHDFAAERLLLVGTFDHVDPAFQTEERARHGERRPPLAGSGLGGDALESLLFGVVGLGDGRVELVAAGGVVSLELVIDARGGPERLFQKIRADERRRPVHLVEVEYLRRDRYLGVDVVQLLSDQFVAEDRAQFLEGHRFERGGIEQRRGFVLHIRADVVPCLRQFFLGQIYFVGDVVHDGSFSFLILIKLR